MGKLLLIVIAAGVGVVLFKGVLFAPPKPEVVAAPVDPLAERAARLAAERERLLAEEAAREKNWQPHLAPTAPAARPARSWQSAGGGPARSGATPQDCTQARSNVNVTSDWMRQGGQVRDTGTGKRLSENETFDAAARNRQYVEDNCRGR
jgi:hypothetical protein